MEHYNLRGEVVATNRDVRVVILAGVVFDGKQLLPSSKPVTVPEWFANDLIRRGRAVDAKDAKTSAK